MSTSVLKATSPILQNSITLSELNLNIQPLITVKLTGRSVFSNDSFCPQAPIDVQLHLALYKLGNDGNASAYKPSATLWGVSEGHFFNCTYRVVTALYRLRNRVICWPDEIARRRESMINHDRGGFIGAVGKLDGTDIVLENKPGK